MSLAGFSVRRPIFTTMVTLMVVVLGLVSSKLPELESKSHLKKRIEEAAKYVPLENLCISPQCGFSSTVGAMVPRGWKPR